MTFNFGMPLMRQMPMMSAVSPFTYRDGATFQEILRVLEDAVKGMVDWTVTATESIGTLDQRVTALEVDSATKVELARALETMRGEMDAIKNALEDLIGTATNVGSATDPVDGHVKSINDALGNIYDNVRVFARFAHEESLTAAEVEALDQPARQIDLAPYDTLNDH